MTEGGPELDHLTDPEELLFRQVHPSWVKDGQLTSQAFKPTPKDDSRLSVSRSALTTPGQAFAHHTGRLGLAAVGTWAVTVTEVEADPVQLVAYSDPVLGPIPDPAHAFIEFPAEPRKLIETKAKLLLAAARRRGRLHPLDGDFA